MTRKDYIEIAKIIKEHKPGAGMPNASEWVMWVHDMAVMLKADNPRFDADRFKKACGLEV